MHPRTVLIVAAAALFISVYGRVGATSNLLTRQAAASHDAQEPEELSQLLEDLVGPLPALGTAPFFGLAILSGASLALDAVPARYAEWQPVRRLRRNRLIAEARPYSSVPVFLALLTLASIAYLANSGKLQGTIGKLISLIEAASISAVYAVLVALTLSHDANLPLTASAHAPGVLTAGLGPDALGASKLLLGLALAASLLALMIVRLSISFLIWLSPIPFVDILFESSKKVVTVAFMVLYFWSPWLALLVSATAVAVSLLLWRWALRLVRFAGEVLIRPAVARVFPSWRSSVDAAWLRRAGVNAVAWGLPFRASALNVQGVKKRQLGALIVADGSVRFVVKRFLRRAVLVQVCAPEARPILTNRFFWTELRVIDEGGRVVSRLALPLSVGRDFESTCLSLNAVDGRPAGVVRSNRQTQALKPPPIASAGA